MPFLTQILSEGRRVDKHAPWPRVLLSEESWRRACKEVSLGRCDLVGLWGEPDCIHMALADMHGEVGVLTHRCPDGRYPAVGALHPPAIRLERAAADLFGLDPQDSPDGRPWLDHGVWPRRHPLKEGSEVPVPQDYDFLPAHGDNLHQIPVGPVHAGIIEPGHFRFTASGETIVRLEARLGYTHKGIESLMAGADIANAAMLAGRVSGDSTVAYAIAFARAVEAALAVIPPPRANYLRGLMGELERLANHLGDIGAICNDASFSLIHAHCAILRERVLRAGEIAFGHRLMRDKVVPGGVATDLDDRGIQAVRGLIDEIGRAFPSVVRLYDSTASLQDRTVGTGKLSPELARQYAAGGFVGRASGRKIDARRIPGYPPYDQLNFDIASRQDGDVNARVWVRIGETMQSLSLISQILETIPSGPVRIALAGATEPCEGAALVEGFRGDILVWLRLDQDMRIERCHLRDPSWFQWPLLEAAIEGNIVADFPLCNKSFNCSYSGHDL